ncbi:MAG: DUF4230 domain-containing protein [Eubacteriales bacterium]
MKQYKIVILAFALLSSLASCAKEEEEPLFVPEVGQMQYICELATIDCYYNNVAKYYQEDATGSLFWKKDKHFWVEYSGIVRVGVDASLLDISISRNTITIKLPMATTLSSKVDETTLTADSFILAKDSADIDTDDQKKAYEEAQANMVALAASDLVMLENARERSKTLLEDYIERMSEATETEFQIKWIYLDTNGKVQA